MKICTKCRIEKDESEFYKCRINKDGLNYWCKLCCKQREHDRYVDDIAGCRTKKLENYQNNKIEIEKKRKKYRLQIKYGLSYDHYTLLLQKQERKCAICGRSDLTLNVDHRHNDGHIRGLLCRDCNMLLGHAYDNSTILRRAAVYLDES